MLTNNIGAFGLINTHEITMADSVQSSNNVVWIDGADGFYYGIYSDNSYTFSISKINKETYEYTPATKYTVNSSLSLMGIRNENLGSLNYGSSSAAIRNGYLYTRTMDGRVVKMPLANPTEVTYVTEPYNTPIYGSMRNGFDFIYKDNNENIVSAGYVIGNNDTVEANERYNGIFGYANDYNYGNTRVSYLGKYIYIAPTGWNSGATIYAVMPNLQYLATINNLDTPVTKTAAKTMKITYVLTYE